MEIKRIKQADDELYKEAMTLCGMSFPLHEQREADTGAGRVLLHRTKNHRVKSVTD